ncbi:MAG: vancomycin resistance protein [Clostridia bacterium]|nr:vancomycin resistance protein [Clostridia bacterium]
MGEISGMQKPIKRSMLRTKCGAAYYSFLRHLMWAAKNGHFAASYTKPLPFLIYSHETVLLRKLKDVDMRYQYNKIVNLKLAARKLNGVVIHPGEIFSYWKLIGKPTRAKGYIDGMVLQNGTVRPGTGGGLCQMSNLIYWMTLHTPLTVIERHRHGYDVFPDSNRTQPFGSGATCSYPHIDLMIRNDTDSDYQLLVNVGGEYLEGQWRSSSPPEVRYEIVEKNHIMQGEFWGGFSRHNALFRRTYTLQGEMTDEAFIVANSALMMYSPFLAESGDLAGRTE